MNIETMKGFYKPKTEVIKMPAHWGDGKKEAKVKIKILCSDDNRKILELAKEEVDEVTLMANIVTMSVVNEDLSLVFSKDDVKDLMLFPLEELTKVGLASTKLSKLFESGEEVPKD